MTPKPLSFEEALTHLPCDGVSKCLYEAHRLDCPSEVVALLRAAHAREIALAEARVWREAAMLADEYAHSDAYVERALAAEKRAGESR